MQHFRLVCLRQFGPDQLNSLKSVDQSHTNKQTNSEKVLEIVDLIPRKNVLFLSADILGENGAETYRKYNRQMFINQKRT